MMWRNLVPILAEIFGAPPSRAWVVDRSLADAGFRTKHKGPRPPDMTRLEALYFMVGCMIADDTPTKAGEKVGKWIGTPGHLTAGYWSGDDHLEEIRLAGGKLTKQDRKEYEGRLEFTSRELGTILHGIENPLRAGSLEFFDVLLRATRWAENTFSELDSFELKICSSHGYAEITIKDRDSIGAIFFQMSDDVEEVIASDYAINRVSIVHGGALAAIACRTSDPLATEAAE